jgi:hypothetical protein
MKKALALLIFLLPLLLSAQTAVLDTTYTIEENGNYYTIVDQIFDNGEVNYKKEIIQGGAQAAAFAIFAKATNLNQEAAAGGIRFLNLFPVIQKNYTVLNQQYQAITGVALNVAAANLYYEGVAGDYEIFLDGATQGVWTLNRPTLTGGVRFSQGATHRPSAFLSESSLLMFIGATPIGLLKTGTNADGKAIWQSIDRRYQAVGL